MSDNNGEFGAFLAGFVIGGLVGAATALILTPQSGEDTRATLSQRGAEWRDRGTQQRGDARERASSVLAETRTRAQEASQQIQERIVLSGDRKGPSDRTDAGTHPTTDTPTDGSHEGEPPAAA